MPETADSLQLAKARALSSSGQFRRARRYCLAALELDPDNPRIIAMRARIDAETKRTTFEQSLATVVELIAQHPDDARLQVTATSLRFPRATMDKKTRELAVIELRRILENYPNDAFVQQCLAGYLGAQKETMTESWALYKSAMNSGPLFSLCYRAAANVLAKRYDPPRAEQVFDGLGPLERLIVRTRTLKPTPMFSVLVVLALIAVSFHSNGELTLSLPLMMLATIWGGWCVYVNSVMCCKKCRNAWTTMLAFLWVCFIAAKGLPRIEWLVIAAICPLAIWLRVKQLTKKSDQSSITREQ